VTNVLTYVCATNDSNIDAIYTVCKNERLTNVLCDATIQVMTNDVQRLNLRRQRSTSYVTVLIAISDDVQTKNICVHSLCP
jgi:hypothetical protein